jgi:hypothetical protein
VHEKINVLDQLLIAEQRLDAKDHITLFASDLAGYDDVYIYVRSSEREGPRPWLPAFNKPPGSFVRMDDLLQVGELSDYAPYSNLWEGHQYIPKTRNADGRGQDNKFRGLVHLGRYMNCIFSYSMCMIRPRAG